MPFMDDQQYIDDLFGDSEPVAHVTLPPNPTVKGLAKRFEELFTSGCCQKIAWSKTGVVATISPDSHTLYVQTFRRSGRSGQWGLTPKAAINLPAQNGEPLHFVHVTWSHFGVDLVAIDKFGRSFIWGTYTGALGRMIQMPVHARESENLSFTIIGLHWLPVLPSMRTAVVFWSASRKDENLPAEYSHASHTTPGPANQNEGRPAFFCLTQNGVLRFFWQLDGPWQNCSLEIGTFMQAGQGFTHASFSSETDRSLILAAHSNTGSLYVYRIEIAWKSISEDKDKPPRYTAAFRTAPLLIEENFGPSLNDDGDSSDTVELPYRLTHLEILPSTVSRGIPLSLPMTILAGFAVTSPATTGDMAHMEPSSGNAAKYTMLTTWEVQRRTASLSSCFDKMSSKSRSTSGTNTRDTKALLRQRTITMPGLVLSWEILRHNTMLAFVMGDGSIDFRERDALDVPISMSTDPKATITTLASAGFGFGAMQTQAQVVLSPNYTMVAAMDSSGKISLSNMVHMLGSGTSQNLPPSAISSLIIHFASAVSAGWQVTDDILSMFRSVFNKDTQYQYLEQSYDVLKTNLDFTTVSMNQHAPPPLFQSSTVHRLWAVQAILGTHTKGERDISGMLSWTALYMRAMLLNFLRTFREQKDLTPEIARSLTAPVTWVQDLVSLIFDEIISTWMQTKDIVDNVAALKTRFTENPPVWMTLMLCSGPRHLLRLLFRQLLICDGQVRAVVKKTNPKAHDHMATFSAFGMNLQNCPIKPKTLDSFTVELEHAIRVDSYDAAGVTPQQRAEHEKRMFVRGEIPDILYPAVQKVLRDMVPQKIQEIEDMFAVRNRDYRPLGLTRDERTFAWLQEHTVDVMRKLEIPRGTKMRTCTRCACRIEDEFNQEIEPRWLAEARRQCICGGPWYVEGTGQAGEANTTVKREG